MSTCAWLTMCELSLNITFEYIGHVNEKRILFNRRKHPHLSVTMALASITLASVTQAP